MKNEEERKRIGGMVAALRTERGLTQYELAQAADIAVANVSKIERGVYNVSIDILSKVLTALQAKIAIERDR